MGIIDQVEKIVKSEIEPDNWLFHVSVVRKRALELGTTLNADLEVLGIAAILHDIGRSRFGGENHENTGAEIAVKILGDLGYQKDKIKLVENCIRKHRGEEGNLPETLEENILANADAMSHFDQAFYLIYLRAKKKGLEAAIEKTKNGLVKRWEGKLNLPEARALVEEEKDVLFELLK